VSGPNGGAFCLGGRKGGRERFISYLISSIVQHAHWRHQLSRAELNAFPTVSSYPPGSRCRMILIVALLGRHGPTPHHGRLPTAVKGGREGGRVSLWYTETPESRVVDDLILSQILSIIS